MRTLGATAILVLFTGLLLACPLHAEDDQGSTPFRLPAEAGFCALPYCSASHPRLPDQLIPLIAPGRAVAPRTGVFHTWLLAHSVEHPPG